jgi:hypothetical protein
MIEITNNLKNIKSYLEFYIEFDATNKRFKFNNSFSDEINCELFSSSVVELKNSMTKVLDAIGDPKKYIQDVLTELKHIAVSYESDRIANFESFHKLSHLITTTTDNEISEAKIKLNTILESPEVLHHHLDDINYYLMLHRSKTNNYEDELDFERVKLHYVMTKYFESIYSFIDFLLDIERIAAEYGIEDYGSFSPILKPAKKGIINLNKIDTANLFNILFKSGILTFGEFSDKKEQKALFDFIEANFQYKGDSNKTINIKKIHKEFSYIYSNQHVERQNEIIDSLIKTFENIKNL